MTNPGVTQSLGSYLRALREERKGSLEEMAHATRVSVRQLQALESDNFAELPAPVFVKGFIRAYCEVLGEPADEALGLYHDMRGEPRVSERPVPSTRPAPSWSASPIFISLALLMVFGAGLLALNLGVKRGPEPVAEPTAPAATVEPVATSPTAPSPAQESRASQRLIVKALEPTWIRIQADDGRVAEELLRPGATREWTAQKRFLLTVGNAGGIDVTLNGQSMPPLGARGAVIRGLELPRAARDAGS